MQTKKFWQSSGFITSVFLFIGGAFVGFPEAETKWAIESLFGLAGGLALIYSRVKDLTVDWKSWLRNANTWQNMGAILIAFMPDIPIEIFAQIARVADAAFAGNWQGLAIAVMALVTSLYKIFTTPKPAAT